MTVKIVVKTRYKNVLRVRAPGLAVWFFFISVFISFKMSKVGTNRIYSYVAEFSEYIFSFDGVVLFCKMCEIKVNSDKRFFVTQHLKTEKHTRAANRQAKKKNSSMRPLITTSSSRKSDFI
jgi:hypothetical protein